MEVSSYPSFTTQKTTGTMLEISNNTFISQTQQSQESVTRTRKKGKKIFKKMPLFTDHLIAGIKDKMKKRKNPDNAIDEAYISTN